MKFFQSCIGFCIYGLTAGVLAVALGFFLLSNALTSAGPRPNDPLQSRVLFQVERGQGLNRIAANLQKDGLIENDLVFVLGARIKGVQSALQAGEYQISYGETPLQIMYKMSEGDVVRRSVTIPEGLTVYQIYKRVNAVEALAGDPVWYTDNTLEGMLLPDTYSYQLGESKDALVKRMNKAMKEFVVKTWPTRDANSPIKTVKEWVTLASIVEKETAVASERKRVAGVFINRLRKGMALQTDPTVIYALTKGKHQDDGRGPLGRRLLSRDLKYDSPYNTYKYPGLPPGPIANPGRAALEAVLDPEEHDYIFFVADGTGGHAFAKTLREHNANVAKWRKVRKSQ